MLDIEGAPSDQTNHFPHLFFRPVKDRIFFSNSCWIMYKANGLSSGRWRRMAAKSCTSQKNHCVSSSFYTNAVSIKWGAEKVNSCIIRNSYRDPSPVVVSPHIALNTIYIERSNPNLSWFFAARQPTAVIGVHVEHTHEP